MKNPAVKRDSVRRMSRLMFAITLSLSLTACAGDRAQNTQAAGQSSSSGPASRAAEAARALLPDNSSSVERVGGEDPRRFFVANLRALNAVDLDGNGLWDDIEAAAVVHPLLKDEEPRVIRKGIQAYQAAMTTLTREETNKAAALDGAFMCFVWLAKSKYPDDMLAEAKLTEGLAYGFEAVAVTSKERVLAMVYHNAMMSGHVSSFLRHPSSKECD